MKEKIVNIFVNVVFVLCIVCIISMCFTKITTGKSSVFGYKPAFVMTGSMEPTIKTHQLVLLSPINADEVKIGDIVTYTTTYTNSRGVEKDMIIIHRVIDITENGFVFKGDNNKTADKEIVLPSQIGYKVVFA